MAKRSNPFAQYAHSSSTLAKRVKYVENKIRSDRREMKSTSLVFSTTSTVTAAVTVKNLTAITQGNGSYEREANKIKVWRVEVRGELDAGQDFYLLQAHDGVAPVVTDFGGTTSGGYLVSTKNNTALTEWRYHRPVPGISGVPVPVKISRKFRGLEVCYPGSATTPNRNALYAVLRNNSGSTLNHNLTLKVWFTE